MAGKLGEASEEGDSGGDRAERSASPDLQDRYVRECKAAGTVYRQETEELAFRARAPVCSVKAVDTADCGWGQSLAVVC